MTLQLPKRRYLTFEELQERWKCNANDLRELICTGRIVPSWRSAIPMTWVQWVDDEDSPPGRDRLIPEGRTHPFKGGDWSNPADEWFFLRCPYETAALACSFDVVCESSTDPPEKDENGFPPFAFWYRLPAPITLDNVVEKGVFMLTEICRFEAAATDDSVADEPAEKPVGTRERNTLLAMISVLCEMAKLPMATPHKAAQLIGSAASLLGVNLSVSTAYDKLKQLPEVLASRGK